MAHILCRGIGGVSKGASLAAGAARNMSVEPKKLAAVLYTYVDGMMEKRAPHRADHLELLQSMTDEGFCLLGGAFVEPCDGAVLLFSDQEKAKQFVDKDPYNTAGLVTDCKIRDYMAVVGALLK